MTEKVTTTTEYKIRQLKKKDRTTLSDLLVKLAKNTGTEQLISMIPDKTDSKKEISKEDAKENKKQILKMAFELLENMLKFMEEDVNKWFAQLLDMDYDDYQENTPFNIEIIVIEQIIEQDCFQDFFSGGSRVVKNIKTLAGQSEI